MPRGSLSRDHRFRPNYESSVKVSQVAVSAAAELVLTDGWSIRKAAAKWNIGASTLSDYLRERSETVRFSVSQTG